MRRVMLAAMGLALWSCSSSTDSGGNGAPPGPPWPGSAQQVGAGEFMSCALASDGTVWCWGGAEGGVLPIDVGQSTGSYAAQCGAGVNAAYAWPCVVAAPVRISTRSFVSLSMASHYAPVCALDAAGSAWCWDDRQYLELPAGAQPGVGGHFTCGGGSCALAPSRVRTGAVLKAYAQGSSSCAVSMSGVLLCQGTNSLGELGNPSFPGGEYDSLVPVTTGLTFKAVATVLFRGTNCALSTAGAAYCWGANDFGQLGIGNNTQTKAVPTAVNGGISFASIQGGGTFVCALTAAGAAYCWGENPAGGGQSFAPQAVAGGHVFTSLSAGFVHVCGIDAAGAAWCWGNDAYGQLGVDQTSNCPGATLCASVPVAVHGGLTFKNISAGSLHTCGVTTSNEVYCWGAAAFGQLGDGYAGGRFLNRYHPVKVVAQ